MIKRIEPASPGGAVAVQPVAQVLALRQRDPWREATDRARQVALSREGVVLYVRSLTDAGVTQNNAVSLLLERGLAGSLPRHAATMLAAAAKACRAAPSRSAICEWCALYREGGVTALLPDHKGRVVEAAGWWGPALEYFNAPSKPDMSAVHRRLVEVDHFAVSYDQVRGYLTGVPAMYGRNSPARIGRNLYKLTQKSFIRRSVLAALPGDILAADGYRADVYLAHPLTGGLWRPELTVCIDVRSGFVPYWRADEHEGTYAVQNMWAEAFTRWNHTPIFLYVDNGSGHKNRLMSDDNVGFYKRAGIVEIIHALPGNPHGKGWIERFFRSMKDDFLKLEWPQFYCGTDASPESLSHVAREINAGRLQPPSLAEFTEKFNAWLMRYHARPSPAEPRRTRAEVWGELQPIPPSDSVKELKRQATQLTVRRASIKHYKREYGHADLHAFNGQKLTVEYDLVDASFVVIRDASGRWICDAPLISAIDVIAPNRLEEARQTRAENAIKRLEKKMAEQQARAGRVIDADAIADGAALIEATLKWIEQRSYTQAALSRLARISASSLNQILKGTYATSPTKLLASVESAMRHADETSGHAMAPVQTSVFKLVNTACDMARRYRNFAVMTGFVGTGKTFALKYYVSTHPNTYFVEAAPTMTQASLTKQLYRLVVGTGKGSIADKFDELVASLKNTDALLIVDEAETLTPNQLHTIRRVRDLAGIGIVLAGTEHLSGLIKPQHGQFDQIRSRTGFWPATVTGITAEDAAALVQSAFGSEEVSDDVIARLYAYCKGSARMLVEGLIAGIKEFRKNRPLDVKLVDAVAKQALCLQSLA